MSHGELIGQNISILMPEPIRQKHQDFVVQYLKSNRSNVIGKVISVYFFAPLNDEGAELYSTE